MLIRRLKFPSLQLLPFAEGLDQMLRGIQAQTSAACLTCDAALSYPALGGCRRTICWHMPSGDRHAASCGWSKFSGSCMLTRQLFFPVVLLTSAAKLDPHVLCDTQALTSAAALTFQAALPCAVLCRRRTICWHMPSGDRHAAICGWSK
jgi:hypothetical protein